MADAKHTKLGTFLQADAVFSSSGVTLDATDDKLEIVFQVPADWDGSAIAELWWRCSNVTTPPTYKVSLQGVDGSGVPDGTIKASGNAFATITPTLSSGWLSLGSSYTPSPGEWLSIVTEYSSGTIGASNNAAFVSSSSAWPSHVPYFYSVQGGVRGTRSTTHPIYGFATASKSFGLPLSGTSSATTISRDTTPDEIGLKFTLPAGWGHSYKVAGLEGLWRYQNSTGTIATLTLYDASDNVLQQVDIDAEYLNTGSTHRRTTSYFDEATLSALKFGSTYRLTLKPTSASNTPQLSYASVDVLRSQDQYAFDSGDLLCFTQRTDGGAWTDTTTKRLYWNLILADVSRPSFSFM
jgi:hypothetical protein